MSEEQAVDSGIRLVQVFLSPRLDGVWRVSIDIANSGRLLCDCPRFKASDVCKHTRFVQARLDNNGGEYQLHLPQELAALAGRRPLTDDECEYLVLHYGKPEVL